MKRQAFFAILMIVSMLPILHFLTGNVESAGYAVLAVSPSELFVNYPQSFTVNVSITNIVDLGFWQIKLLFNPSILACTNVVEPADGIFAARDAIGLGVSINNTAGYVTAYDALWTIGSGFNGSGTVCQIRFTVSQPGISSIAFTQLARYTGTILYDSAQFPHAIPFDTANGYVQADASGFQSISFQVVKDSVTYNVVIFTNSTLSNFNYYEGSDIIEYDQTGPNGSKGSCIIPIPNGLMNVSYFAVLVDGKPTYFAVYADGASHFLIFTYGHSTVEITILSTVAGDLNADRKVDMKDVAIAAYSFSSTPGTARWNAITDVNGDLKTDMKDLAFVAKCFGQRYQPT